MPIAASVASAVVNNSLAMDSRYVLRERPSPTTAMGCSPRWSVTTYDYGGNANDAFLVKVTRKDGAGTDSLVTALSYNSSGYAELITDEDGTTRSFNHDGYGRLKEVLNDAGVSIEKYEYEYSRKSGSWAFDSQNSNAVVSVVTRQYFGRPRPRDPDAGAGGWQQLHRCRDGIRCDGSPTPGLEEA